MRGRRVFGRVLASLGQRLVQPVRSFAHVYEILCAKKGGNRTRKRGNFRQLNARISLHRKCSPGGANLIIYADSRGSFFGSRLYPIRVYWLVRTAMLCHAYAPYYSVFPCNVHQDPHLQFPLLTLPVYARISNVNLYSIINPTGLVGVDGYHVCLTHRRSPVRVWNETVFCLIPVGMELMFMLRCIIIHQNIVSSAFYYLCRRKFI
jgi:hypothetical protein